MRTTDGKRRAAVEVLLGTSTISDLIKRSEFSSIKEIMEKSRALGMQTFDQALFDLVVEGVISEDEAVKNADSANNLRLKLKLYRDGAVSVAAPVVTPSAPAEASNWGLELILEELQEEDGGSLAH
ncbi:twitching motility protein [compost metagenome]